MCKHVSTAMLCILCEIYRDPNFYVICIIVLMGVVRDCDFYFIYRRKEKRIRFVFSLQY